MKLDLIERRLGVANATTTCGDGRQVRRDGRTRRGHRHAVRRTRYGGCSVVRPRGHFSAAAASATALFFTVRTAASVFGSAARLSALRSIARHLSLLEIERSASSAVKLIAICGAGATLVQVLLAVDAAVLSFALMIVAPVALFAFIQSLQVMLTLARTVQSRVHRDAPA